MRTARHGTARHRTAPHRTTRLRTAPDRTGNGTDSIALHGAARCGMAWHHTAWHADGTLQRSIELGTGDGMACGWHATARNGTAEEMAWHTDGMLRHGAAQVMARHSTAQHGMASRWAHIDELQRAGLCAHAEPKSFFEMVSSELGIGGGGGRAVGAR